MSDQEISPSPDADPPATEPAAESPPAASQPRAAATQSSDNVMGTGEGPPPGTRFEALLITLLGLAIMLLPVLGVLRRVADSLHEAQRLRGARAQGPRGP